MNQAFDPLNLLILAIAVVIFFKLRSVLGQRTGTEKPPFDPFRTSRRNGAPQAETKGNDNVITLPRGNGHAQEAEPEPAVWKDYAEEGSALAGGLVKIVAADKSFSPRGFLEGAKIAYETIVSAFAAGDRGALKPLLSREVFENFTGAIDAREKASHKMESRFVGIHKADLVAADLIGRRASVTVRFVSQLISATISKAGELIDGDPKEIREITDVWTFERDVTARDPNWKLIATGDAA
jgi:predicted lipid-binding transport protein (Tim44 family)